MKNLQLSKIRIAFKTFHELAYGTPSPAPWRIVFGQWRNQEARLRQAGASLGFDLVELGMICESAREAAGAWLPNSVSLTDPPNVAARYLRGCAAGHPPELIDYTGLQNIQMALHRNDDEFIIALGRCLEVESMEEGLNPDAVKSFLVHLWCPRVICDAFWPGLAYMSNPARARACKFLCVHREYDERTLRGTWRRLRLLPARPPLIRQICQKDGSITFA